MTPWSDGRRPNPSTEFSRSDFDASGAVSGLWTAVFMTVAPLGWP
jgi:hypothetical protein